MLLEGFKTIAQAGKVSLMAVQQIIARLSFRLAKTMPQTPHEYTVRAPETEVDYVALYDAIQRDGVAERYGGRKKKYLYPGDGWKYWAMTTHLPSSRVLNRMRIEDDLDRLQREGQPIRNDGRGIASQRAKG